MPAQRILAMFACAILLPVAGCGSKHDQHSNSSAPADSVKPSASPAADAQIEYRVADLPVDSQDGALPDLTIPLPAKKPAEPIESGHTAGDVVDQTPETNPTTDGSLRTDPEPDNPDAIVIAPPPPPTPRPAGAPARSTTVSPSRTETTGGIASGMTIRRDGVAKEHKGFSSERVFFATNRGPTETLEAARDPDLFFGDEIDTLSYGICEVSIPYKRAPGSLPEPSILSLEFSQDPQKHVVLMEIERLPDAAFWKQLRERVESSPKRQLMVFVHGYCATFRDAARRTAQLSYDMNYQGPAMFFSWPAGSEEEAFQERANYLKDLRRAEESDEDLIIVIEKLSRLSGAERIHLIAHSMGNFILTEALKTIDDRRRESEAPRMLFDQVVMAAPDVNSRDFVSSSGRRIRRYGRRITVYASKQDKALKLSRSVNGFEPLGLLNDYSREGARNQLYELVDASTAESGWFDSGHVYYGDMPEMLKDLAFVFRGIPATSLQRGLGETPPLFRLTSQSR